MYTAKILSGMIVLILAVQACSAGGTEPNIQETVAANVPSTQPASGSSDVEEMPTAPGSSPIPGTVTGDANSDLGTPPQCQNDYYLVVKGAKREFKYITISQGQETVSYQLLEITQVFDDTFIETSQFSGTQTYNDTSLSSTTWHCLPEGIALPDSGPGDIVIPDDIQVGTSWTHGSGTDNEMTYTAVSVEWVTVPAGTFEAIKVEVDNASTENQDYSVWYAREVGVIKYVFGQGEITNSIELISYSIPR